MSGVASTTDVHAIYERAIRAALAEATCPLEPDSFDTLYSLWRVAEVVAAGDHGRARQLAEYLRVAGRAAELMVDGVRGD